jgi:zinc protease
MKIYEVIPLHKRPLTPQQSMIKSFVKNVENARKRLQAERDRQRREGEMLRQNRFIIFSTEAILKRMLHDEIREKQNLVYSISVQSYGVSKFPEPKYSLIVMFDSDPNNKDKIFRESEKVLEKLKAGDFPDHYLDEAIKGHLRRYELDKQSNRWWTGAISDYYHEKEPLETAETLDKVIKSVTKEDIKKLASNTFDNKYIEASLMPKR